MATPKVPFNLQMKECEFDELIKLAQESHCSKASIIRCGINLFKDISEIKKIGGKAMLVLNNGQERELAIN